MISTPELRAQLEALIDDRNLYDVLHAIAIVCAEKSLHLKVAWNDRSAAKQWALVSYQIDRPADKIHL